MKTIKWYQSKLVWLGVLITFQGSVPILIELLNKQAMSVSDVLVTLSGIATVVARVWFTTKQVK